MHNFKEIDIKLKVYSFQDEGLEIMFCPLLDLYGYGKTKEDCESFFNFCLENLIDYKDKKFLDEDTLYVPEYYKVVFAKLVNGKVIKVWRASDGDNDIYTEFETDNIIPKNLIEKMRNYEFE